MEIEVQLSISVNEAMEEQLRDFKNKKEKVVTNRRFNLGRQSHFIQEINKRTL